MTKLERISMLAGILILGSVLVFTRKGKAWTPPPQQERGTPAADETAAVEPVNVLADELKEAWSDHHTET